MIHKCIELIQPVYTYNLKNGSYKYKNVDTIKKVDTMDITYSTYIFICIKADSHVACRAAKGLECVFPI